MIVDVKELIPGLYPETDFKRTYGNAGLDLRSIQAFTLQPGERKLIGTGLAIHIRREDVCAFILPRSGLGNEGLVLGNLIGLIDTNYQGELKVSAWNRNSRESGKKITVDRGARFAQMVFLPYLIPHFCFVEEFEEVTDRGINGFGHSGTQ